MYGTSGVIHVWYMIASTEMPPPASRQASPAIQRRRARGLVVWWAQGAPLDGWAGLAAGRRWRHLDHTWCTIHESLLMYHTWITPVYIYIYIYIYISIYIYIYIHIIFILYMRVLFSRDVFFWDLWPAGGKIAKRSPEDVFFSRYLTCRRQDSKSEPRGRTFSRSLTRRRQDSKAEPSGFL